MKAREIQLGGIYVNKTELLVREVAAIRDEGQVEYLSYWLDDGKPDGLLGICQKQSLANWASREATADEAARLQRADVTQRARDSGLHDVLTEALSNCDVSSAASNQPSDDFTIRDEANALVAWAFRNGPLEDLHAGKPSSLLDDPALSRITDEEMKTLLLSACRQLTKLLELKESDPAMYQRELEVYNSRYCRDWER